MNEIDRQEALQNIERALRFKHPKAPIILTVDRATAKAFQDFLRSLDPDMPPMPVVKALGPLVGDFLMNRRLERLDQIANSIGPTSIRLSMLCEELERKGR